MLNVTKRKKEKKESKGPYDMNLKIIKIRNSVFQFNNKTLRRNSVEVLLNE